MGEGSFCLRPCGGFALQVFGKAGGFGVQPLLCLSSNPVLRFKLCQRDAGLREAPGGGHLRFSQGANPFARFNACALTQRILAGKILYLALADLQLRAGGFSRLARLSPAQMRKQGFQPMDFFRQAAVTPRLARLTLEAGQLALHLGRHFGEALEVGLRRVELQFSFMAARVEAGDPGGFLKDAAAVLRLGADQL